jgi:hypothetical protein
MYPPVPRIEIKENADGKRAVFVYPHTLDPNTEPPNTTNTFEIPFNGAYEYIDEIELGQTGLDLDREYTEEELPEIIKAVMEPHPFSLGEVQYRLEIWDPSPWPPGLIRLKKGIGYVCLKDGYFTETKQFREVPLDEPVSVS